MHLNSSKLAKRNAGLFSEIFKKGLREFQTIFASCFRDDSSLKNHRELQRHVEIYS